MFWPVPRVDSGLVAFTFAVVAYLGWWRPVLRDDRPVARRVWVVPIIFIIDIVVAIHYSALGFVRRDRAG